MHRSIVPGSILVLPVIVLLAAAPAQASTDPVVTQSAGPQRNPECTRAEAHLARGLALRRQQQDEAALGEFTQAQALCPDGRTLAQRALAEQALGQWLEAEAHLQEALRSEEPWIRQHHAALRSALQTVAQHLGNLEVVLAVPLDPKVQAVLQVNGKPAGTLPHAAPIRVVAGTIRVTVTAPGYAAVSRDTRVDGGGFAREAIPLVRLSPPPAAQVAPALPPVPGIATLPPAPSGTAPMPAHLPAATAAVRPVSARLSSVVVPLPPRLGVRPKLGIAGLVLGATLLGGGLAADLIGEQNVKAWNQDSRCTSPANAANRPPECGSRLRTIQLTDPLAIVGYAAGGALAVSGIVLLALPRSRHERRVALAPGPGELGLAIRGRF